MEDIKTPRLSLEEERLLQHEARKKAWAASGLSARENFLGECRENVLGLQEEIADLKHNLDVAMSHHGHHVHMLDGIIERLERSQLLPDSPRKPGSIAALERQVELYTGLSSEEAHSIDQMNRRLTGLRAGLNSWKQHMKTFRYNESISNWQAERAASLRVLQKILVRNLALQHLLNGGDENLLDFDSLKVELFAGISREEIIVEASRRDAETGELEYPEFNETEYFGTLEDEVMPFLVPLPPLLTQ